jgi:hypothetical protein
LGGPERLHTPVLFRGSELLSRRLLIEEGLHLMSSRGLVTARMDDEGITYIAGPTALSLVGSVTAPYFTSLLRRCEWAASLFGQTDSDALTRRFTEDGHRWGAELEGFTLERSGAVAIRLIRLTATGPDRPVAEIEFAPLHCLIRGPSDTGKSYIRDCLWYLLGGEKTPKKVPEDEGYESLELEFSDGFDDYVVRRALRGGGAHIRRTQ